MDSVIQHKATRTRNRGSMNTAAPDQDREGHHGRQL
jgi:hypothetical protein